MLLIVRAEHEKQIKRKVAKDGNTLSTTLLLWSLVTQIPKDINKK
uniref:Uncharacterized protein n=1 Tax=Nelumbo nucifera TaxID=4432 RepID=A0A822XW10_NELNU|nr:TPA_asm: hypothetical protein HUJ06_024428 [Nelumbo nucifera]